MDYRKIYSAFIASRKSISHARDAYTEKHHIQPRSLGGSDDPENLVRLTPEDHYFAHLLLAKIHGGSQWRALHAMAYLIRKGTERRSRLHLRFAFGHVRRSLAEHYREASSGQNGAMADKRFHEVRHFDGRVMVGRRFYLEKRTGVPRQQLSAIFRGEKKSAHGWYVPYHNPNGLDRSGILSHSLRDRGRHTLYHFDGREWSGSFSEFQEMTGSKLFWQSEAHKHIKGWYASRDEALRHNARISERATRIASARGNISGARNPRHDPTIYEFWNFATEDRAKCTRHELCVAAGIEYGDMSAVLSGKRQSAKGWTLWSRRNEKFKRPALNITLERNGVVISGNRQEIAKHLNTAPANVSYGVYNMRIGKINTYRGWSLVSEHCGDKERPQPEAARYAGPATSNADTRRAGDRVHSPLLPRSRGKAGRAAAQAHGLSAQVHSCDL